MSTYLVKEVFLTLQGEGAHAGRPAVFCRFTGCNLWTGREEHRSTAVCQFCDTDFVGTDGPGGGQFRGAAALAVARAELLAGGGAGLRGVHRRRAHAAARRRAGRRAARARSRDRHRDQRHPARSRRRASTGSASAPRPGAAVVLDRADEVKLVYPQRRAGGRDPSGGSPSRRRVHSLQPMDGPERAANTAAAVDVLPGPPRVAPVGADPQGHRHPLTGPPSAGTPPFDDGCEGGVTPSERSRHRPSPHGVNPNLPEIFSGFSGCRRTGVR